MFLIHKNKPEHVLKRFKKNVRRHVNIVTFRVDDFIPFSDLEERLKGWYDEVLL